MTKRIECKHGMVYPGDLKEGPNPCCSLCLGKPQSVDNKARPNAGTGTPPWFANSSQMAARSNFGFMRGERSYTSRIVGSEFAKTSLPPRKKSRGDPKVFNRRFYKEE